MCKYTSLAMRFLISLIHACQSEDKSSFGMGQNFKENCKLKCCTISKKEMGGQKVGTYSTVVRNLNWAKAIEKTVIEFTLS